MKQLIILIIFAFIFSGTIGFTDESNTKIPTLDSNTEGYFVYIKDPKELDLKAFYLAIGEKNHSTIFFTTVKSMLMPNKMTSNDRILYQQVEQCKRVCVQPCEGYNYSSVAYGPGSGLRQCCGWEDQCTKQSTSN